MMEFTQNYWGQRDIINKIKILKERGTATIYAVVLTKYHKYPSTKILRHVNVLAKVNKSPWGCLYNIMPHGAYSIMVKLNV